MQSASKSKRSRLVSMSTSRMPSQHAVWHLHAAEGTHAMQGRFLHPICQTQGVGTAMGGWVRAAMVQQGRWLFWIAKLCFFGVLFGWGFTYCAQLLLRHPRQTALKEGASQLDFMGKTVEVNLNAGLFVTLNPAGKGYGGRSKLPDNLQQMFRWVSPSD